MKLDPKILKTFGGTPNLFLIQLGIPKDQFKMSNGIRLVDETVAFTSLALGQLNL